MTDVFTKAKRSDVMSRIRGSGNKATEIALIKLLRKHQIIGWRRHQHVFGKPDFLFRRNRLALFVDGCFWHGCPRCYRCPNSNNQYWHEKVARNKARDRHVNRELRKLGWRVVRIWEHDLGRRAVACILKIQVALNSSRHEFNSWGVVYGMTKSKRKD
jgi:DNA mismatch endonuclease (patch repair protein)